MLLSFLILSLSSTLSFPSGPLSTLQLLSSLFFIPVPSAALSSNKPEYVLISLSARQSGCLDARPYLRHGSLLPALSDVRLNVHNLIGGTV